MTGIYVLYKYVVKVKVSRRSVLLKLRTHAHTHYVSTSSGDIACALTINRLRAVLMFSIKIVQADFLASFFLVSGPVLMYV